MLLKLFVVFPVRDTSDLATEVRSEAYYEALEPYTVAEVDAAVKAAIATPGRVWMPTPGELIEIIQHDRRETRLRTDRERRGELMLAAAPENEEERAQVQAMLDDLKAKLRWRP